MPLELQNEVHRFTGNWNSDHNNALKKNNASKKKGRCHEGKVNTSDTLRLGQTWDWARP